MFIGATASQGTATTNEDGAVVYSLGSMDAGSVVTLTTILRTTFAGKLTNAATVYTDATDTNSYNDTYQNIANVIIPMDSSLSAAYAKSGTLRLTLTGQSAVTYAIEYSTNLTSWNRLFTNTIDSTGKVIVNDSFTSNSPARFYRAVRLP